MQAKTLLIGSVVINAALVGALALRPKSPPPLDSTPARVTNSGPAFASRSRTPIVITERDAFQWTQIETPDYEQYIANLRAIGCPEETIRDLVIAEINKLYAPKFAALRGLTHQFAYWKPNSRKPREELQKQLDALRAEKKELLRALLGVDGDPSEQWVKVTADELVEQGKYGFLSPEKQAAVREILDKYKQLDAGRTRDLMVAGETDSKKLREQRREELAQILSPDELYQFDLRDSNTSQSVRSRFGEGDISEDEYKKLFDLRKAYESEVGAIADNSDPDKMRQRSERRQQLEEQYRQALGEDRMKEIQREQDPQWRALNRMAQQHGLDEQTILRAYEYQNLASEQVAKLYSDGNIPRENRRAATEQITQELQKNLSAIMGEQAYKELSKSGPTYYFNAGGDTIAISQGVGFGPARTEAVIRTRVEPVIR